MENKTIILLVGWIIIALFVTGIIILNNRAEIQNKKIYITEGTNCFANGVLCKNISCDMPGGCYAKDCIGGVEYSGAITIKCINITRSK